MRIALLTMLGPLAIAWITSLVTRVGINLYNPDDLYMASTAFGYELRPETTDEPVGRYCRYLAFDGIRSLILIEDSSWQSLQEAMRTGASIDHRLAPSVVVDDWYAARCPLSYRFAA